MLRLGPSVLIELLCICPGIDCALPWCTVCSLTASPSAAALATYDPFAPSHEPARSLYEAFQAEAKLRKSRPLAVWIEAELDAVHRAACACAARLGWPQPTRAQVEDAERYARGSADYGSKWALVLERSMRPPHAGARPSRTQVAP